MKIFYLPFAMILFFSCTTDHEQQNIPEISRQDGSHFKESHPARNIANPYDHSGLLFDELFSDYYLADTLPSSTVDIVDRINRIAGENGTFQSLKSIDYTAPTAASTTSSLACGLNCVADFIANSSLSMKGRLELATFINSVVPLANNNGNYQDVHSFIVAFEDTTLNDPLLTLMDKEVLLITSSISRFSAYRTTKKPKKKEDPEWDLLVTHLTAGASGAELNVCAASARALATGIAGQ